MFAPTPRIEFIVRVFLTAVMLFNALVPVAIVKASSLPDLSELQESEINASRVGQIWARAQTAFHYGRSRSTAPKVNVLYQDDPPTETPTPTPSATESEPALVESSAALLQEVEASATPEVQSTSTGPALTEASTASGVAPVLSFDFFISPEQAAPGDEVTFTIQIVNIGKTEARGIQFSNTLPQEFGNGQKGLKDFDFDPQTRLLSWDSAKGPQTPIAALQPGQTITLQYSIQLDFQIKDETQIVDSAALLAEGLTAPLEDQATVTVLSSEKQFTKLGAQGGKAIGLNGRVQMNVPEGVLEPDDGILIQEIEKKDAKSAGLLFSLERRASGKQGSSAKEDSIRSLDVKEAEFDKPVELTVSFEGIADLATLGADYAPYLVTLDEDSSTWVRIPLKSIDREAGTITAEIKHFSTWGAGIGPSFPQNGANVLLFDSAYPGLFTGTSNFSIPLWTPPGRNGMAPDLALSYSGGRVNGVLGDVQAPWVGMGWNIDSVEISRKITSGACDICAAGSYGYENEFLLLFNGTGYELILDNSFPGWRYRTKSEDFLFIELHNYHPNDTAPSAPNVTGEWWEVVEKNGTRWRLGWNPDSEQLAAMKNYPGIALDYPWWTMGYGGRATHVVASRWRADLVTDRFGNQMSFTYEEEPRLVEGTSTNYDRASYLKTIAYAEHTSGTPAAAYSVEFVPVSRGSGEVPVPQNAWDNWDTYLLDRVEVKYNLTTVRTYDLDYEVRSRSDEGKSWQTTVLTSLAISGGDPGNPSTQTFAPPITFTYVDKDNRDYCGTNCPKWAYPRLETVHNGWGGSTTFTYEHDGRPYTSWYNWRTSSLEIADGVNASPMKTTFAYSQPCYNDEEAGPTGWCNTGNIGGLIGYGQTTATTLDFGGAVLGRTVQKFYTDEPKAGRDQEVQNQDAAGTILSKTVTDYTIVTTGFPVGVSFTYANQVDEFLLGATLALIKRTQYDYDPTTGNLLHEKEFDGTPALYRQTDYDYVTNMYDGVWILNTVARRTVRDGSLAVVSVQEYGYDGQLPGVGGVNLTQGELTLSRIVNGTQALDTGYVHDDYGNLTETRQYKSYGMTGVQPGGSYLSNLTDYDEALKTYIVSIDPPLIPATTTEYDYGQGLPTSFTDPNGNTTTTTYDKLGRVTSVTYPGYAQANVKYTYPSLPISAPFALKMEAWDETAAPAQYRSAWQIMDGLGRVLQTQSPYEAVGTNHNLIITDFSYNAQGLALYQGLPRNLAGTGGSHFTTTWGTIPHTTNFYDALGRTIAVLYPDSSQETLSYSGLRTTAIDRNGHKKVQQGDAFGRLVKVEEYTGASPSYTLYATTEYDYDQRDLLKTVTDAVGNTTTIDYDGFGRKIEMTDPDMGNWRYQYDAFGNLTVQIDAKRQAINMYYDDLNRLVGKTYNMEPVNPATYQRPADPGYAGYTAKYYYDSTDGNNEGIGRRTKVENANGTTSWIYNALGQPTMERNTIDGTNYEITSTLDAFGRPLSQTLPSSETLDYDYNAMGALSSLSGTSTYASNIQYNASGQVTSQQLGNGLFQQSSYEANTLRLSNLQVRTDPSSLLLDLSYTYQPNGNVSQIVDHTQGETLTYAYDELDRLLRVKGPYAKAYTYDPIGNLTHSYSSTLLIAAGSRHTCAVTSSGDVQCWGANNAGQLGDGTITNRSVPVEVPVLEKGVTALTVGGDHTCARTSKGAKCWGRNDRGQLGDGTTTQRLRPVAVDGLTSGVNAISAGAEHTCAMIPDGGMKCWGSNDSVSWEMARRHSGSRRWTSVG